MATEHAKPGDTIVVNRGTMEGSEFEVIERPKDCLDDTVYPKTGECAWVDWDGESSYFADPSRYDIIKRGPNQTQIAHQNTDDHLSQQRDVNLKSVFG